MKRRLLVCGAVLTAMCFAAPSVGRACDGCGLGYGWGYGLLYQSLRGNVPHFAAFPPVYYSYPVPRTYGYSPFAYPPHVLTPDFGPIAPLEIINPHVPRSQPREVKADRTVEATRQPEPLVIVNPFVAPGAAMAQQ